MSLCVYLCIGIVCPCEILFYDVKYKGLCITKKCDTLVNLNEKFSSNMLIFCCLPGGLKYSRCIVCKIIPGN